MPTRSVIFVSYSEGGTLIKQVKEVLGRMERILGYRVKAVEKTGVALSRQFPLTQLWEGVKCGRLDCVPCNQGGAQLYPCTRRSVSYQNICLRCHPEAGGKEVKLDDKVEVPSI